MKEFGAWLKNRRVEMGMKTQEDVRAVCGLSTSLYGEIEKSGAWGNATQTTKFIIATILNVTVDELNAREAGRAVPSERNAEQKIDFTDVRKWMLSLSSDGRISALADIALLVAGRAYEIEPDRSSAVKEDNYREGGDNKIVGSPFKKAAKKDVGKSPVKPIKPDPTREPREL